MSFLLGVVVDGKLVCSFWEDGKCDLEMIVGGCMNRMNY